MNIVETATTPDGRPVEIWVDPDPMSPREWDNLGTFQIYHRRYASPDPIVREPPHFQPDEVGLKVWGYDHGGIIYRTGETNPFTCPWDSGFAGIIFATEEHIKRWFCVEEITDEIRSKALEVLRGEVETYSKYVNGEVYGFTVGEESCGGFYSIEEARNEATAH